MRVAIDARPAAFPRRTGIGTYTWHLLKELPALDRASTYVAWYLDARRRPGRPGPFAALAAPNLENRRVPLPTRWFDPLARRFDVPRVEWFTRFDVLLAPNFIPPPTRSRRVVVTVHDLAFRLFPQTAPEDTRRWLATADRAVHRAARVVAISECTKRELMESFRLPEERITVIPLGTDLSRYRPAGQGERAPLPAGIDRAFFLFLGGIEPRKNLPRLVEAYARLPVADRPLLVLVGPGESWNPEGGAALRGALETLPGDVRRDIRLTGYLGEDEKLRLLQAAEALVFPSLYEGFGMPIIEAMACATPVLSSNVSAIPEVAADAALLVDPFDVEAIREGMERLLTDTPLRDRLRRDGPRRAARFPWERTARLTNDLLHEVAGG